MAIIEEKDNDILTKNWIKDTPYLWVFYDNMGHRFYIPSRNTTVYNEDDQPVSYSRLLDDKENGALFSKSIYSNYTLPGSERVDPNYINYFLLLESKNKEYITKYELRMNGKTLLFPSNFSFSLHNVRDYCCATKFPSFDVSDIIN